MPKGRKPTPKSQKQISNNLVEPLNGVNPNTNLNRGNQLSYKDDTTKPLSIGIQDIDESILFYFENIIKPTIIQNGVSLPVPIMYGNPERWKSVQKDGFLRDKNGKIMSPLLVFKRDSFEKDRTVANKLDGNQVNNLIVYGQKYSPSNYYSSFDLLNNRKPTTTYYAVAAPDYVTLTYSCAIYTYYIEQMNKIIEAINFASDSYWGNPERFKFRAKIDSFTTVTEVANGENRSVKSTFNINLKGYIIPDSINASMANNLTKVNDKSKVIFSLETSYKPDNQ
jgi:hypothetical protein